MRLGGASHGVALARNRLMSFTFSTLGEKLTRHSGIVELMDDLGHALADAGERPICMLGGGNPAHIPAMQDVWRRRLAELAADPAECDRMLTNYDPPAGNRRFRASVAAALAGEYGWPLTADNVAVTSGGQSAFFYLFNLLAGDSPRGRRRILLPLMPEYIGYADQGIGEGLFVSRRARIERLDDHQFKYHVDFDALEIGDDVAAICVTRPTNPSGNVLTDDEIASLAALARGRNIPLIVDNAYGQPFPGAVFTSAQPIWDPGVILTFSLSKLGLPGTRTGIVVADEDIVRRIASLTAIVGLANGNLGQAMVRPLLDSGELLRLSRDVIGPYYVEKSRLAESIVRREFANDFPYAIHRSEGAFFLWLWFPELPIASRVLYERLKARGVLIIPGEYFFYGDPCDRPSSQAAADLPWDNWRHAAQCVRMTFTQSPNTIEQGVRIIADELRTLHAE
jgi:valine--pyruvate aminotransferase